MTEEKKQNEAEQASKKENINLEDYKDLGGVSLKKLNRGLWFIEHRKQLRLIFVGFLVFISAISWVYSIYGFAYYIAKGMKEDDLLAKEIVQSISVGHDYINQISPRELQTAPPKVLKAVDKKYDFLVQIKNPNPKHWAEFEYYFLVNGQEIGRSKGYVMPSESKYLVSLANEFNSSPANVKLVFDNFHWGRVNQHVINDWGEYNADHLDIVVSGKEFLPAKASGLSEKLNLNDLKFEVKNRTAYSYWNVDFVILLWSGPSVVGVNKYSVPELLTSEQRKIEVSWPGILSRIDRIDILPEINIMKDDIYIDYEGGVGEVK